MSLKSLIKFNDTSNKNVYTKLYYCSKDEYLSIKYVDWTALEMFIEVLINLKDQTMIVIFLHVKEKWRNKGYGSALLKHVINYAKELKLKQIELDDCSDNFNKSCNLYTKLGFTYNDYKNGPEMTLVL